MKLVLCVFLALGLPAVTFAGCPNACNGRGDCGASNVCACYEGWTGGDCSYRKCPTGLSWSVTDLDEIQDDRSVSEAILETPGGYLKTDSDGNYDLAGSFDDLYPKVPAFRRYAECSGRGTCDYSTGQCSCFPGYEGKGCRRSSCPNDCSGHGRCLTNVRRNSDYSSSNRFNDQMWDQDKTQSCDCDRGYTGYDCSERICPSGDDPTTDCGDTAAEDYQLVYVALEDSADDQFFSLTFTDMFGGEFSTRPINTGVCTEGEACRELQYALMELPNFAIPDVEADLLDVNGLTSNEQIYLVHFDHHTNIGKQNTMTCNQLASPNEAGSSPKYEAVLACEVLDVGGPEWFDSQGNEQEIEINGVVFDFASILGHTEAASLATDVADKSKIVYNEFVPCSNQGTCNVESGECSCDDGHFGAACDIQNIYA